MKAHICLIVRNIWLLAFMHCLYSFVISLTQQLDTCADASLHLLPLKRPMVYQMKENCHVGHTRSKIPKFDPSASEQLLPGHQSQSRIKVEPIESNQTSLAVESYQGSAWVRAHLFTFSWFLGSMTLLRYKNDIDRVKTSVTNLKNSVIL